jgi:type II secretory pathway pseudopilin PulG
LVLVPALGGRRLRIESAAFCPNDVAMKRRCNGDSTRLSPQGSQIRTKPKPRPRLGCEARGFIAGANSQGFTLIETLIATALSIGLLSFLISTLGSLRYNLDVSADRAAMAERASQLLAVLSAAAASSGRSDTSASVPLQPCLSPEALSAENRPSLLLAATGRYGCLPQTDMPADAKLLMIDALSPCDPTCPDEGEPGFLYLNPGCHPVLARTTPEVRWVSSRQRPADCGASTAISVLERQLFYFRDYAWQRGDGLGAVMMKRLLPESPVRWSRAEMLIAGVSRWDLVPRWSQSRCPTGLHCTGMADGVDVSVAVEGWVRDTTANGVPRLQLTRTLSGDTQVVP